MVAQFAKVSTSINYIGVTHEKNSQKKKRNLKTVRARRSLYHAWRFIRPIDRCGIFLRVAIKGNNIMSFDDAIEAVVTKREAIAEIKAHGLDPQEFFDEVGRKEEYVGLDVLSWLGY